MADEILCGRRKLVEAWTGLEMSASARSSVMSALKVATIVEASNVAKYLYEESSQEVWTWREDFPNLAPPFDCFFVEYKRPKFTNDGGRLKPFVSGGADRVGALLEATRTPGESGWVMRATVLWSIDGHAYWSGLVFGFPINKDGSLAKDPIVAGHQEAIAGMDMARAMNYPGHLFPVALAISLMHCKNIVIKTVAPPEKLSKKHNKKHGVGLSRHLTIEINPMKEVLKTEGGAETVGLQRALSICRGHFKSYNDRPLFGRLKGTFWWPQHARGSAELGVIDKSYSVTNPGHREDA